MAPFSTRQNFQRAVPARQTDAIPTAVLTQPAPIRHDPGCVESCLTMPRPTGSGFSLPALRESARVRRLPAFRTRHAILLDVRSCVQTARRDVPILRRESSPPPIAQVLTGVRERRRRVRQLAADFRAEHIKGMAALVTRDYKAFGDAIRREREIVSEHAALARSATPSLNPNSLAGSGAPASS